MRRITWTEIALWLVVLAGLVAVCQAVMGVRYPVGQNVPHEVYTAPFDPCDPIYKFLRPPPPDWAERFGDNERTCLIHAVSELRVVVSAQSKRLVELEAYHKDPNDEGKP